MGECKTCSQCGGALPPETSTSLCPRCAQFQSPTAVETVSASGPPECGGEAFEIRSSALGSFGEYELLKELGRGGMGVVYEARQTSLHRRVALKMLLGGPLATPRDVQRFHAEAEAVATLDHPNIIPIHEVGEHDGRQFFTMRLLTGASLTTRAESLRDHAKAIAALMVKVARAVHHAHQRGILHRDLKPGNILFDEQGEPHVTDFGLAKFAARDSELTQTGAVVGTPSYMAPEQAAGEQLTVAADVYGLGAVLYHLLTGKPPFRASTPAATLREVIEKEPERPSSTNRVISRDLETICLKCLEKDPRRRYATAAAIAEDLERWLRHEPIHARPATAGERLTKWVRRRPALAALTTVSLLAASGFLIQTSRNNARLESERNIALDQKRTAEEQRARAEAVSVRLELQRAENLIASDHCADGLAVLAQLLRRDPTRQVAAERALFALLRHTFAWPVIPPLSHTGSVRSAHFSPDGGRIVTASADGTVQVWETMTGRRLIEPLTLDQPLQAARFSPDGAWVAAVTANGAIQTWDASTGNPVVSIRSGGRARDLEFSPNGGRLLSVVATNELWVWDVRTGRALLGPHPDVQFVRDAHFSPDGKQIVTASADGTVRIWDADNGRARIGPVRHGAKVNSARFSPDGKWIVTSSDDGTARLWDARTGQFTGVVFPHKHFVLHAEFSPDGQRVATICEDRAARIWDARTGEALGEPLKHGLRIVSATFSPDGHRIVTASHDRTARVWDAFTGEALTEPFSHELFALAAEFAPNGYHVLTCSSDGTARVWDVRNGRALNERLRHSTPVHLTAFSPDGRRLATATTFGSVQIWDVTSGRPLEASIRHSRSVDCLRFSADGRWLATGTRRGTARVWDVEAGQPVTPVLAHSGPIMTLACSPDGLLLASGSADGQAKVWEVQTGKPVGPDYAHRGAVSAIRFSPDGQTLLTASHDGYARLWEVSTGRPLLKPVRHPRAVHCATFSPDAARFATGGADGVARIFDTKTGLPVGVPSRHEATVVAVEFDRTGGKLLSASLDGTARLWDGASGEPLSEPFKHREALGGAELSGDGRRVLTYSFDHTVRLWDTGGGIPLAEPVWHPGAVLSASLSADGQRVASACGSGIVELSVFPRLAPPTPSWFPDLLESMAGRRVTDRGLFENMESFRLFEAREEFLRRPATDELLRAMQWFFADRGTRAIAPGALSDVTAYVRYRIQEGDLDSVREAIRLDPTNVTAVSQLSRLLLKRAASMDSREFAEAAWNSIHAVALGPTQPDAWWARAEVLEQSGDVGKAMDAAERAISLDPLRWSMWVAKSGMLARQGRIDDACAALTKALELAQVDDRAAAERRPMLRQRAALLRQLGQWAEAATDNLAALEIPARDPSTPTNLLDLSAHYNLSLADTLYGNEQSNHLGELRHGIQTLAGTAFDIRGLIHLHHPRATPAAVDYPARVDGIPVRARCRRLHFLHGHGYSDTVVQGTEVATYVVRFADGQQTECRVAYGRHVRLWWGATNDTAKVKEGTLAWTGSNPATRAYGREQGLRLYSMTWENPRPEVEVSSLDYVCPLPGQSPFLIAVTSE